MAEDKAKTNSYRIQGRVSKEQYERYKEIKKFYIKNTGEVILDGQFIMRIMEEWAENNTKEDE